MTRSVARLAFALPTLAVLACVATAHAQQPSPPSGWQARWVQAVLAPVPGVEGQQRVVVTVELSNRDDRPRPVKPLPLRFRAGGERHPSVDIDFPGITAAEARGDQPAGARFEMVLGPEETVTVRLPSRPLPAGHPAASGSGVALLELSSPNGPPQTVRGPVLSPADVAAASTLSPTPAPPVGRAASLPGPWPGAGFQRGVVYSSWDGSYAFTARWKADLDHFEALGVTWIQLLTFAHQPRVEGPEIEPMPAERWPRAFVAEARRRGFKVLVKPHVWSREFYDGSNRWRGSIKMADAETWAAWFQSYGAFIEREAKMAAESGAEMFSVGLEYVEATRGHGAAWRKIIERVRAVYPGVLTYAADGNHEARHVDFWDALDVIGIDAYFDVGVPRLPGGADLRLGWLPHVAWMKALSERVAKPVVFTEAGYPSVVGATTQPWKWPSGDEAVDMALQARAYDALLTVCTAGQWCQGVFWWKYYEKPERGSSHDHDYSPRGKPAEAVLRRWYTTPAP